MRIHTQLLGEKNNKNQTNAKVEVERFSLTLQIEHSTYPAEAARISWRFALVNRESTAENMSVETSKMPIHTTFDWLVSSVTETW